MKSPFVRVSVAFVSALLVSSLCAAARVPPLRVTGLPELEQALATPNGGIEVVEARVRRDNRAELDAKIRALFLP